MLAAGYNKIYEEEKVALLLTLRGDELLDAYNSIEFPTPCGNDPDPAKELKRVLENCYAHFAVKEKSFG